MTCSHAVLCLLFNRLYFSNFIEADHWWEQPAVVPWLTDVSDVRARLLWASILSGALLTHWFLLASFRAPLGSYCLVWELFCSVSFSAFSLFYFILFFFRVNRSSVWTPDLCNYCPELVYPNTLQLYHHWSDWSCGGNHQYNRSLLIKGWTCNIESDLCAVGGKSWGERTGIAYLGGWQAHGSSCCRPLPAALTAPQVEVFLCKWPQNPKHTTDKRTEQKTAC